MAKSSGENPSNGWRDRLIQAFQDLDLNQDGVLSQSEIDIAVLDSTIDPKLAEIIALLKSEFSIIQTLNPKDSKTPIESKLGLTNAQLEALANVIHENLDIDTGEGLLQSRNRRHPKGSIDYSRLARAAHAVADEVREVFASKPRLYKDETNPIESISCDAVRQGIVGNCVFLSALASVANAHPTIVSRMIKDNKDNTYTVTFPGARQEPITVNRPTAIELALYTRLSEWGFWPAVIEKAYGIWMSQMAFEQKIILAENTSYPEYWIEIFALLTGQTGAVETLSDSKIEKLTSILNEAFQEKRVVTAWSLDSLTGTTFFEGIPSNHAYSVIDWDAKTSKLTLRNPWGPVPGSEPESDSGFPLDGCVDGIFKIDLDRFWSNFWAIHYEKWSSSDPYVDPPEDRSLDFSARVPIEESQRALEQSSSRARNERTGVPTWLRISIGLIVIVVGILASAPQLYGLTAAESTRHWPTTTGTIEPVDKSIVNLRPSSSTSAHDILYSYKVQGKEYKSNIIGGMIDLSNDQSDLAQLKAEFPVGKKVDVHFNPKKPEDSCLKTGFDFFKTIVVCFWLLVSLGIVIVGVAALVDRNFFNEWGKSNRNKRLTHIDE